ncbi:cyclic nucleotide-binding domain-containing protein [Candidatus Viridilinea mediisalina]|uniref:Cyclic nucleotide-binding protein n=1 Tax=Candidatus Viridilinea mediisalina TaxID=2024553 RepID=A0A2A6RNT2_9CHLR|nr:cyclic nucleotide-binding domain-containing protein [Candidatus Viridilinea mediisalina]PDW04722.1 cyclic nucleotide-binding protein [Candidatus Viridilinea mediisalina]
MAKRPGGTGTTSGRSPAAQARTEQQNARRQERLALLESLDCLRGAPPGELARLSEYCTFRAFQAGATVLGQQRHDRFLFLVLRGTLELHLRDKDGCEVLMGVLGRGDCCGEGPLFGEFFRRMSALAQSDCYLLQVPLNELRNAQAAMPMVNTALRRVYKQRMIEATLARVPLLSQLLPMERLALAALLRPANFAPGELIMQEGSNTDALYLIESGHVTVEQGELTIATLGEGDFFGEIALLTNQPHRAGVRALTTTTVLALPGEQFHELIASRPDLEAQLRSVIEQRMQATVALSSDTNRGRELEFAVQRGLLRGAYLLVRTPSLCSSDCRYCEDACAARHGRARLKLNGAEINGLEVADACRQCSVGPECAEVCPEAAFERTETGVLLITERCTGCGECIPACPYDAVARVSLPTLSIAQNPFWNVLHHAIEKLRRHPAIPLEPTRPTHRADKCDFCYGYDDIACIDHCPTDALRMVSVEEIFPL